MTTRFWVIGGDYDGPEFRALVPGTETMAGPFECEAKARLEWTRLACRPEGRSATRRFSIATETIH